MGTPLFVLLLNLYNFAHTNISGFKKQKTILSQEIIFGLSASLTNAPKNSKATLVKVYLVTRFVCFVKNPLTSKIWHVLDIVSTKWQHCV